MTSGRFSPYCGDAPAPGDIWAMWNFDPVLLAVLAAVCAGGLILPSDRVDKRLFLAGWAIMTLAFISPFCALTSALFSARVSHHLVLMTVASALLVWSASRAWLENMFGGWVGVGAATAIQAVLLWAWHAPSLYNWSLTGDFPYWIMQSSLIGSALLFWRAVRLAPVQQGLMALLGTMVQMGALGALITFAGTPLYDFHAVSTLAWGFSQMEDQQAGGLIMWAPAAAAYLAGALVLLGRWLGRDADIEVGRP